MNENNTDPEYLIEEDTKLHTYLYEYYKNYFSTSHHVTEKQKDTMIKQLRKHQQKNKLYTILLISVVIVMFSICIFLIMT